MTVPMDAGRAFSALMLLTTALFLLSGRMPGRAARLGRRAAVAFYGVLLAGALVAVGLWLFGVSF
jgi:hypothetical protein